MADEPVIDRRGGIAYLTFSRPASGNALTREMGLALADFWQQVMTDAAVQVIILTGAGPRHFCLGVDLKQVAATGQVPSRSGEAGQELRWTPLHNEVWKPVICVVNGVVAGGGLHFVAEADIVVAEPQAAFMDTHVSVGMVGAVENIGLLSRLPLGAVLRMTLSGREYRMPVAPAHELGLVDELAGPGCGVARAEGIAAAILTNSPAAVQASKQAVWHAVRLGLPERLDASWRLIRQQWDHFDFREGAEAFASRRSPRWQDG